MFRSISTFYKEFDMFHFLPMWVLCLCEISAVLFMLNAPVCGQEVELGRPMSLFSYAEEHQLSRQWKEIQGNKPQMDLFSENLGEKGGEYYARENGWSRILSSKDKAIRQGFDQVWKDYRGNLHILEVKGGSSQLGWGYGKQQGTMEWVIEVAKKTLNDPNASQMEIEVAQEVLEKTAQGKVCIHTVQTRIKDYSVETIIKKFENSSNREIQKMAEETLNSIKSLPKYLNKSVSKAAWETPSTTPKVNTPSSSSGTTPKVSTPRSSSGTSQGTSTSGSAFNTTQGTIKAVRGASKAAQTTSKVVKGTASHGIPGSSALGAVGVGLELASTANQCYEIHIQCERGEITPDTRNREQTKVVAGAAVGTAGAYVGAEAGALTGVAVGGSIGSVVPIVGTAVGAAVGGFIGGIAGGWAGYFGGKSASNAVIDHAWR